jgi:hypothetical protein
MAGALIFVIYPSADGSNVTVSPRLGTYVEMRRDGGESALLTFLWFLVVTWNRRKTALSQSRGWMAPESVEAQ